jgi:hypothetical protein
VLAVKMSASESSDSSEETQAICKALSNVGCAKSTRVCRASLRSSNLYIEICELPLSRQHEQACYIPPSYVLDDAGGCPSLLGL